MKRHYGLLIMNSKIKTREEINKIAEDLRKKGKTIVTTNGSFDMLHIGHVKFLQEAKQQGDVLIVGLNSDSSVKENKGEERPINNEENRALVLAALECVDYVVVFDEKTPLKLMEVIRPNVHVNGEEYGEDCIEAPIVKKFGGKIHLVKKYKDFSTTKLIEKIKNQFNFLI